MELKSVAPDHLLKVLGTLVDLPWPVPADAVPEVVERLGWVVRRVQPGRRVNAETDFGLNRPESTLASDRGELTEIDFNLTDVELTEAPERDALMRDAFAVYVGAITQVWGKPARRKTGARPSCIWDTPNGARINVGSTQAGVACDVLSPEYAAVERANGA